MQKIMGSMLLVIGGLCLFMIGAGNGMAGGSAVAHAQNESQARPTLTSRPENPQPTTQPTARATTGRDDDEDNDTKDRQNKPTAVVPGRITGTVIDQTTGAPAGGIVVRVGETTLTTDGNGNYDLEGLAPGNYTISLVLNPAQGVAAQQPTTVVLAAGAVVVQHLAFRSPAILTPTTDPATTATPIATIDPVMTPISVPTGAPIPFTLPATGTTAKLWLLLPLGIVLGGLGGVVRWQMRRRR